MSYDYDDDDLIEAINDQAAANRALSEALNEAVQRKDRSWLRELVESIAATAFGVIIARVVKAVIAALL